MKHIVVIVGSPRKGGNTDLLADALIAGALAVGNTVDKISVAEEHIAGCLGCNACRRDGKNHCVQRDDMDDVYARMAKADVLVFATPVYFYGVSSQLKCLIDRLHNPIRNTFQVKKLALLSVCADTLPTVFDSIKTMYALTLSYFSLEDGGMVCVHGVEARGAIGGNPALKKAEELGRSL